MTDGTADATEENPRDELSRRLKALFRATGMSTTRASDQLMARGVDASQSKVSRTINARVAPDPDFVARLCVLIDAPAADRDRLVELAHEIRKGNRRLVLGRDPVAAQVRIRRYVRDSTLVRGFALGGVPGELQLEPYVWQVMEGYEPGIRERMDNQQLLDDLSRSWRFVLPEGALGFPGLLDAPGMAAQLEHIVAGSRRPNVEVGIIPWGSRCPVLPLHAWNLYDERVVVLGGETFAMDITEPQDIAAYVALTDRLEALAVWGDGAREILAGAADRYRTLR